MSLIVGAHVVQVETLWQVVIELDGAELSLAAEGILYHEVQLGAVERGLTFLLNRIQPHLGGCFSDGLLCALGKLPPQCSIKTPMKRSSEPNGAR